MDGQIGFEPISSESKADVTTIAPLSNNKMASLTGLEPISSVSETDVTTIAPQGNKDGGL